MIARALWGLGGGTLVGGLYGVFGRCARGQCHLHWNAAIPTIVGAVIGLLVVACSRWD